jgi:hypothetical protein
MGQVIPIASEAQLGVAFPQDKNSGISDTTLLYLIDTLPNLTDAQRAVLKKDLKDILDSFRAGVGIPAPTGLPENSPAESRRDAARRYFLWHTLDTIKAGEAGDNFKKARGLLVAGSYLNLAQEVGFYEDIVSWLKALKTNSGELVNLGNQVLNGNLTAFHAFRNAVSVVQAGIMKHRVERQLSDEDTPVLSREVKPAMQESLAWWQAIKEYGVNLPLSLMPYLGIATGVWGLVQQDIMFRSNTTPTKKATDEDKKVLQQRLQLINSRPELTLAYRILGRYNAIGRGLRAFVEHNFSEFERLSNKVEISGALFNSATLAYTKVEANNKKVTGKVVPKLMQFDRSSMDFNNPVVRQRVLDRILCSQHIRFYDDKGEYYEDIPSKQTALETLSSLGYGQGVLKFLSSRRRAYDYLVLAKPGAFYEGLLLQLGSQEAGTIN